MTWPEGIAAATGLITALLITRHQHRSTTHTQHIRRTEQRHAQDHQPAQDHTSEEGDRQEDRDAPRTP